MYHANIMILDLAAHRARNAEMFPYHDFTLNIVPTLLMDPPTTRNVGCYYIQIRDTRQISIR